LYGAFLFDKIEQVRILTAPRLAIAYTPTSGEGFCRDLGMDFALMRRVPSPFAEALRIVQASAIVGGMTGISVL
jgi:hypothetical protein